MTDPDEARSGPAAEADSWPATGTAPPASTPPVYGASVASADRRRALATGRIPIAVAGLGKLGLPVAAVFAEATGWVVGVDVDPAVAAAVDGGDCPVSGEPGLPDLVASLAAAGDLTATTDGEAAAAAARVHVVVVPTLVEGETPDLSALDAAVATVGAGLDAGDLVVVESTLPPGTCRDRLRPRLAAESGLSPDDFGLAFCPERTSSGRALRDVRGAHPKVVGGADEESARAAVDLYGVVTDADVVRVADATTAETVKVFEGVYRDVNIALANELATLAADLGVDVRAAIRAANGQPYCDIHDPGPGVGGHCIPYYPWFVVDAADRETPLLRTARAVNDAMPAFVAADLLDRVAERGVRPAHATVLVLGLTYRAGVAETRKSPAFPLAADLDVAGVTVLAADPLVESAPELAGRLVPLDAVADCDPDAVAVVTPHEAVLDVDWTAFDDPLVLDGRDALDADAVPHDVYTLGGP